MSHVVDTSLMDRLHRYGAFDVNACFNCGNCTAVCPLSKEDNNFPRRLIRYGQVGMEDRLLAGKELWLCYYCGECSETCPREADPGEYMAAARRYAIARYDKTGLGRLIYGSVVGHVVAFLLLSAFFTVWLLWHKGAMNGQQMEFFKWIPGQLIHDTGIGLFVVIGLGMIVGVMSMVRRILKAVREGGASTGLAASALPQAIGYAVKESLGQFRYRECDEDKAQPWFLKPWFVHMMILWGFLGLLGATTYDFLFKPIGEPVSLLYPARLLGTVAGLASLYGLSIAIYRRVRKSSQFYANTRFSDWFFLLLLFVAVLTGFAAEILAYVPNPSAVAYVVTLIHVVLAIDLVVLLPVTKFAHAVYRPLALLMYRWVEVSEEVRATAPAQA